MSENHRYNFLDSSRGLAAFVVLLAHTIKTFLPDHFSSSFDFLWDSEAAVLYFFILSGFVLTESVSKIKLTPLSYFNFICKRILRIYPVFLVVLLITFFLFPLISSQNHNWLSEYWKKSPDLYDLFKQAILIFRIPNDPALRLLPHDWTLSIEILISLALPFLAWISRKNSLFLIVIIIAAVKLLPIDNFIFDFSLGCIISTQKEKLISGWKKINFLGHAFLLFLSLTIINLDAFLPIGPQNLDAFMIHFKSWGLAILLIAVISSTGFQNLLNNKFLVFQGKISYSFYLIHFILIAILSQFNPEISFPFALTIIFLTTIILSATTYYIIEKPCIQVGKKYFTGQKGQ